MSEDTRHWERFVSKNKKKWILTHSTLKLEDVLKFKEDIINNNYLNLYKTIVKK